jgi:hypothetical protein
MMRGRPAEAAAVAGLLTDGERAAQIDPGMRGVVAASADAIISGGILWAIDHADAPAARAWALAANRAFGIAIPDGLKPALVLTIDELYHHPQLGLARRLGPVELGSARLLFDLYPARRLIELSRRTELAPVDRRALVGAAWVRAYALGRWDDLWAWLPDIRRSFPEIEDGALLVDQAWFGRNRRHLATRLLLRAPGLVALPSWARPPGGIPRLTTLGRPREIDVLKFDTQNPSDGNWWCGIDADAVKADAVAGFLAGLDGPPALGDGSPFRRDPAKRAVLSAEADRLIATLPLLKDADLGELKQLAAAGSASERLAQDALGWARDTGGVTGWIGQRLGWDALLPQTLALAVRATRFGCRRPADNGPWSKAVWTALRDGYPGSEWAVRTPYWFAAVKR